MRLAGVRAKTPHGRAVNALMADKEWHTFDEMDDVWTTLGGSYGGLRTVVKTRLLHGLYEQRIEGATTMYRVVLVDPCGRCGAVVPLVVHEISTLRVIAGKHSTGVTVRSLCADCAMNWLTVHDRLRWVSKIPRSNGRVRR